MGLHVSIIRLIAGISVSNLTDSTIVFHITREDPKQKVCGYMQAAFVLVNYS